MFNLNDFKPKDYIHIREFDFETLEQFLVDFSRLEADPLVQIIPIYISSYGGDAYALSGMRDLIKSSQKPVSTICLGTAMSCGAFLLAMGTKGFRYCSPSSEIMVHEVAGGSSPLVKASEKMQDAIDTERLNEKFFKNFSEDTGNTYQALQEKITELRNADWYLTAQEAKKWGIVDHIATPRIGQSPQVSFLALVEEPKKRKTKKKEA